MTLINVSYFTFAFPHFHCQWEKFSTFKLADIGQQDFGSCKLHYLVCRASELNPQVLIRAFWWDHFAAFKIVDIFQHDFKKFQFTRQMWELGTFVSNIRRFKHKHQKIQTTSQCEHEVASCTLCNSMGCQFWWLPNKMRCLERCCDVLSTYLLIWKSKISSPTDFHGPRSILAKLFNFFFDIEICCTKKTSEWKHVLCVFWGHYFISKFKKSNKVKRFAISCAYQQ